MCAWPVSPDQAFMQWQMKCCGSFCSAMPSLPSSFRPRKWSYSWLSSVQSRLGPFVKMCNTIWTSLYRWGCTVLMLATQLRALRQLSCSLAFTKPMLEGKDDTFLWETGADHQWVSSDAEGLKAQLNGGFWHQHVSTVFYSGFRLQMTCYVFALVVGLSTIPLKDDKPIFCIDCLFIASSCVHRWGTGRNE